MATMICAQMIYEGSAFRRDQLKEWEKQDKKMELPDQTTHLAWAWA